MKIHAPTGTILSLVMELNIPHKIFRPIPVINNYIEKYNFYEKSIFLTVSSKIYL